MDLGCDLTGYNNTKETIAAKAVGLTFNPNPSSASIFFNTKADSPMLDMVVFDMQGRMMNSFLNINTTSYELKRNELSSGMYYVQIRFEEGVTTQKVVFN